MRIAFISDLHADVHALEAALKQIERLGCDSIVCVGDLVDGGLFPNELISVLRERGIPCIRGNHDRWALGHGSAADPCGEATDMPYDATAADLSGESLRFLAALPLSWSSEVEGVRISVHHARPSSDMDGVYPELARHVELCGMLDDAEADVLVVGHTHVAFCIEVGDRGMVANPGALLSATANAGSAPWLYDPETKKFFQMPDSVGGTFGVLDVPSRAFRVYATCDGAEIVVHRPRSS